MNGFMQEATERGFISQCTDTAGLEMLMNVGPVTGYIGFDCTADSLHVGSLMQLMLLRLMQKHGHNPIALLGGATTLIGDPSGKDESRKMLTEHDIESNTRGIHKVIKRILNLKDSNIVNNLNWMKNISFLDMLRDVGPHFTLNRMLTFDSVKLRLEREQPLTFLEFNYMILQSFDFRELSRRNGVVLQMGGSDQWGNIVSGADLIRRTDGKLAFGLTTPLLQTASGKKMGKTENGAIWLDSTKTSRFEFFQFWRNVEDADVGKFLRLFTDMPMDEIRKIDELRGAELNPAKEFLADFVTNLVHGPEVIEQPFVVKLEKGQDEVSFISILHDAGLVSTRSEGRRIIEQGGARVDDAVIANAHALAWRGLLNKGFWLSVGKKKKRFVKLG